MPSTLTQKRQRSLAPKRPTSSKGCKGSKTTFSRHGIFPFLSLPSELRNAVYELLLIAKDRGRYARDELNGTMRVHQLSTHPTPFSASDLLTDEVCFARRLGVSTTILRTCKQIYGEAIAILYQNGFLVDLDYRKSVLSQSPAVVARLWEEEETPDPVPITIPPAWDVSRITKLHLRIEMHRLRSRLPAHIQTFSYPDLNQMVSLNTLEISVLYTLWSEKWTGRMEKLHDHVRKMAFFRGERENERLSEQLQEFVKYILRSIPKKVNKVVWVDGSEGWRLKRTMPVQLETGLTFLEPLSPSVKPTTPRTCMYVKREVLEMAADEVDVNRGRGLERYRRIVKEVEEEETEPGGGSGRG